MKRKSISILIISVVILSLFLANIPVSAASDSQTTKTYAGEDLYDLFRYYGYDLRYRDGLDDTWSIIDPDEYQILYQLYNGQVYIVVHFYRANSYLGGMFEFAFLTRLNLYVNSVSGSVTGRDNLTHSGLGVIAHFDGSPVNYNSVPVTTTWPRYNLLTDSDGNKYIDEQNPFYGSYTQAGFRADVSFVAGDTANSVALWNNLSTRLYDYEYNGSSTFIFRVDPFTITTVKSEIDRVEESIKDLKDSLNNMTPEQEEAAGALKDSMNSTTGQMSNSASDLKDAASSISSSVSKPSIDITDGFALNADLSDGLSTLAYGYLPLYENKYVLLVMAAVVPVFIVSYLLFGKKG